MAQFVPRPWTPSLLSPCRFKLLTQPLILSLLLIFFWCRAGKTGSLHVAQPVLEFTIPLSQPPEYGVIGVCYSTKESSLCGCQVPLQRLVILLRLSRTNIISLQIRGKVWIKHPKWQHYKCQSSKKTYTFILFTFFSLSGFCHGSNPSRNQAECIFHMLSNKFGKSSTTSS